MHIHNSMKGLIGALTLATAVSAASSSFPTIRVTTVSTVECSSCLVSQATLYQNSTSNPATTSSISQGLGDLAKASSSDPVSSDPASSSVQVSSDPVSSDPITTSYPVSSSSSSKVKSTIYAYETEVEDVAYEVTKTICPNDNECYVTTDLESSTTYTTTVDGVLTVITTGVPVTKSEGTTTVNGVETIFTTYCPLTETTSTSEEAVSTKFASSTTESSAAPVENVTETEINTTVITITSCSQNACKEITKTTGVTTVTEANTIYTTYCPLSSESTSTSSAENISIETSVKATTSVTPESTISIASVPTTFETPVTDSTLSVASQSASSEAISSEAPAPTSSIKTTPLSTINVITNNIITETASLVVSLKNSSSSSAEPSINLFTYEGAAVSSIRTTGFLSIFVALALAII